MTTETSTPATAKPERVRPKLALKYGGPTSTRPLPQSGVRG